MELKCPECGGPVILLGIMGRLAWYRCRNCGGTFCQREELEEPGNPEDNEEVLSETRNCGHYLDIALV
jgi:hypothetical protein